MLWPLKQSILSAFQVKLISKIFKGTKVGPRIFQGVLARCTKGRDEPHWLHTVNLRGPPPYIPIGLWWDCSIDTRFVNLAEMSFTDPRGGLNFSAWHSTLRHKSCWHPTPYFNFPSWYSKLSFSSWHVTLQNIWPRRATIWPSITGPTNRILTHVDWFQTEPKTIKASADKNTIGEFAF